MSEVITKEYATGEEIAAIIDPIEDILVQLKAKRSHAFMALLSMAVVIQHPEIQEEELRDAVSNISQYICLYVAPSVNSDMAAKATN